MSRRWATIFLAVVLLATAVSLVRVWQVSQPEPEPIETAASVRVDEIEAEPEIVELAKTREVVLYFPSKVDDLAPEIRTVEDVEGVQRQVEALMSALLEGPEGEDLLAPLAEEVGLGGVYLGSLGVVYVDLRSEQPHPPATGSRLERLIVGSLVESVLANLPELDGVVLLWNGVQPDSFAGHLDTSIPLRGGQFPIAPSP
jgi:hypothetical protein